MLKKIYISLTFLWNKGKTRRLFASRYMITATSGVTRALPFGRWGRQETYAVPILLLYHSKYIYESLQSYEKNTFNYVVFKSLKIRFNNNVMKSTGWDLMNSWKIVLITDLHISAISRYTWKKININVILMWFSLQIFNANNDVSVNRWIIVNYKIHPE